MVFIKYVMVALAMLVSGATITVLSYVIAPSAVGLVPLLGSSAFLVGAVGSQLWIFHWARVSRKARTPNFDMIVASELLIAFGVFSLIIGIVESGVIALMTLGDRTQIDLAGLRIVLLPFAEGLFASGLGPLLGSLLRQMEVLQYGEEGKAASDTEMPDLAGLIDKVRDAVRVMDRFAAAWKRSEEVLHESSEVLKASAVVYIQAAERIEAALASLAGNITTSGNQLVGEISRTAASFNNFESRVAGLEGRVTAGVDAVVARANEGLRGLEGQVAGLEGRVLAGVDTALTKASDGLNKLQTRADTSMRDFGSRSNEAATALGELVEKTRAFGKAAEEGTMLLAGLQKIIESVNSFVHPDRPAS